MAFEFIIIYNEIHIFQNINTALAKHQKIKRTHLQKKKHLIKKIQRFY